jgi:divalent metal cation (Fe/Co/Zn/Cd) transporter
VNWRLRVEQHSPERADAVERRAVRMIAIAFFALAALVAFESIRSLTAGDQPDVSRVGIALTAVSLLIMPILARHKRQVGRELGVRSVEADARQTMA